MNKKTILSFLGGFAVIFLVAATTDQIIQAVYDSSNTALRVNLVAGGSGTPVPTATAAATATPANTPVPTATAVPPVATPAITSNVLAKGTYLQNSSITDNGTTVSTSEALSVGAFSYNGKLTVADVHADSSNFTVANRIHYVTTGASTIAATTPASPTVGDTYTVVKADNGAGTIVWTRAGSQVLNGATTRTISAQYGIDTCVYMASNAWLCQGAGG